MLLFVFVWVTLLIWFYAETWKIIPLSSPLLQLIQNYTFLTCAVVPELTQALHDTELHASSLLQPQNLVESLGYFQNISQICYILQEPESYQLVYVNSIALRIWMQQGWDKGSYLCSCSSLLLSYNVQFSWPYHTSK